MMLSIRNTLRSISLIAATIAFAPGCDDGQIEALGLSAEEIDAMSEDELDELAALEDLTAPVRPGDPHPGKNPDDLREPAVDAHHRPGTVDAFGNPIRFTHAHQRPGTVPGVANPVRPTHDDAPSNQAVGGLANEIDDGCETNGDGPDFTNG